MTTARSRPPDGAAPWGALSRDTRWVAQQGVDDQGHGNPVAGRAWPATDLLTTADFDSTGFTDPTPGDYDRQLKRMKARRQPHR